jgi:small nuclear ribonucleoprotein B and B'
MIGLIDSHQATKGNKMQQWLNYRMRVTVQDSREMIGRMLAFDKHMNLILADTEEYRRVGKSKSKGKGSDSEKQLKRTLGLVLIRGENIVSLSVEGPPPADVNRIAADKTAAAAGGPGVGRAAARGVALPPTTVAASASATVLTGAPVKGLGGPGPSFMQPTARGVPAPSTPAPPVPGPNPFPFTLFYLLSFQLSHSLTLSSFQCVLTFVLVCRFSRRTSTSTISTCACAAATWCYS